MTRPDGCQGFWRQEQEGSLCLGRWTLSESLTEALLTEERAEVRESPKGARGTRGLPKGLPGTGRCWPTLCCRDKGMSECWQRPTGAGAVADSASFWCLPCCGRRSSLAGYRAGAVGESAQSGTVLGASGRADLSLEGVSVRGTPWLGL